MPDNSTISPSAPLIKKMAVLAVVVCTLLPWLQTTHAQAPFPPPNQIQVFNIRGLDFGSFYPSATGGSVIVDYNGLRTPTGDVVLVGGGIGEPAIFEVVLIPGRLVSIELQPSTILSQIGGTGTMTLYIGPSDRGTSFVTTGGHPFRNQVNVGGTLEVRSPAANPPGNYTGSFTVTFHQN